MLAALRKRMLGVVADVLRRWLEAVTAQLEAAPERRPIADADAAADDASSPVPPDHWVELVRQHAPQLLGEDAAGDGVFEYRANEAFEPTTAQAPSSRTPKSPPVHAVTNNPTQATPIPTVRTKPKRAMRLTNVHSTAVDVEAVAEHSAQAQAAAHDLPTTPTTAHDGAEANVRRGSEYAAERRTEPLMPDLPDAPDVGQHFAEMPVRQRVREVWQGEMDAPDVPSVRTRAGNTVSVNQRRTKVPEMPQQVVFRPTTAPTGMPQVNFDAVTPERWASLPEMPQDEPRGAADETARRARLKREQEGRSWSE